MSNLLQSARFAAALRSLREAGVVPAAAVPLRARVDTLLGKLKNDVMEEVPAYTASGNPDILPELGSHLQQHLNAAADLLDGRQPVNLDFIGEHARRRAAQKFPLDAELAAYRCLHQTMADSIREAALEVADASAQLRRVVAAVVEFASEYISAAGTVITAEYVAETRRVAESEADRRSELFNLLLGGYDEADVRIAQLLRRAGYLDQRQSFCVVVARSVDPREMENAARAERMADAVGQALSKLPVRALIGVHDNLVTVILSGTRRLSGWTAPHTSLADRACPPLRTVGPAALIGISNDAPSTAHIPNALGEARRALDFASVGNRVMPFADIPFRDMLVRVAAEQMQSTLPAWLPAFIAADKKARGALTATLRAYADNDMNALKTAKALSLHPNTIYARMQRINDVCGRNPLTYNALTELLLATDCARLQ